MDYAEAETTEGKSSLAWVWLQREDQLAYLIYPSETTQESVTFPDAEAITVISDRINIAFVAAPEQQFSFTRFGGEVTLTGESAQVSYTPEEFMASSEGNTYVINDDYSMDVSFNASSFSLDGQLHTNGGNLSIYALDSVDILGTSGIDTIFGADNTDTTWEIGGNNSGNISTSNISSTISYNEIESLMGGSQEDTFILLSGATFGGTLDDGSGNDVLIGSTLINGWIISAPTNSGGTICRQSSSLTINSGNISNSGEEQTEIPTCDQDITSITNPTASLNNGLLISDDKQSQVTNIEQAKRRSSKGGAMHIYALFLLLPLLLVRIKPKRSR